VGFHFQRVDAGANQSPHTFAKRSRPRHEARRLRLTPVHRERPLTPPGKRGAVRRREGDSKKRPAQRCLRLRSAGGSDHGGVDTSTLHLTIWPSAAGPQRRGRAQDWDIVGARRGDRPDWCAAQRSSGVEERIDAEKRADFPLSVQPRQATTRKSRRCSPISQAGRENLGSSCDGRGRRTRPLPRGRLGSP